MSRWIIDFDNIDSTYPFAIDKAFLPQQILVRQLHTYSLFVGWAARPNKLSPSILQAFFTPVLNPISSDIISGKIGGQVGENFSTYKTCD